MFATTIAISIGSVPTKGEVVQNGFLLIEFLVVIRNHDQSRSAVPIVDHVLEDPLCGPWCDAIRTSTVLSILAKRA